MYYYIYGFKNKFDIEYVKNIFFEGSSLLLGFDFYK